MAGPDTATPPLLSPEGRDLRALPKAHLHVHFVGSMQPRTLLDLAIDHGVRLPAVLAEPLAVGAPPRLVGASDQRGWFRFQRLYDIARSVVRTSDEVRRVVMEAAAADARDGGWWTEIQVDPSGYAGRFGGVNAFTDLFLDAAREATARSGARIATVIAASRVRNPLDARTLARVAAHRAHAGVVGFGLSNDERVGTTAEFATAFRIADRADLALVPHGGELRGPESVAEILATLRPHRLGHGVRAVEDPAVLDAAVARGVGFEVCPGSNVALGVYADHGDVPVPRLTAAGARVALGADDPLLFGSRLADQYDLVARRHGLSDAELAQLARDSFAVSRAPAGLVQRAEAAITAWLAAPVGRAATGRGR